MGTAEPVVVFSPLASAEATQRKEPGASPAVT